MSSLHVCPLSRLVETVETSGARHVASLINAGMEVPYPLSVPVDQRLFLGFNDIVEDVSGFVPPEKIHAEQLIDFVRDWDREHAMVIHCWMGVSRSTAGVYIAQCTLMPDDDEDDLAQELRAASPEATPNIRLVQFADQLLGRDGRMVRAIEAIGRGEETFEGVPFSLPVR
ncbi:MAG: tyrosine phosphatase family protein [Pseudomonadota bacterium]